MSNNTQITVITRKTGGITVVGVGRGPQGAAGPSGVATVQLRAAQAISGHKAVYAAADGLRLADNAALATADVLGITTGAAAAGELATVQVKDLLTEPSWAWLPGPVYLGSSGALTQLPPGSGAQTEVATAMTATALLVRVFSPIVLS